MENTIKQESPICAILNKQAIVQIKHMALYDVCQQIKHMLCQHAQTNNNLSIDVPVQIRNILDKLGNIESASVACYLYEQIQSEKSILAQDIESIKLSSPEELSVRINELNTNIESLSKKIKSSQNMQHSDTSPIVTHLKVSGADILQYYNVDNDTLADIKIYKPMIDHITDFTKQIRTKWFLLLDHIDDSILNNDDAKHIYERFVTYSDALNTKINEERESCDYFADILNVLSSGTLDTLVDEYRLLWDELTKQLYPTFHNDELREIIVDLNCGGSDTELLPTKDKFTTTQLEHNYEVLNADLTKFALADITQMNAGELVDFVTQYQTKIKKSQAISKELHNRRINHKISIISRITNIIEDTQQGRPVYELYNDVFEYIMHNDVIIHKWNLLMLLNTQQNKQSNSDSYTELQSQLDALKKERDLYITQQKYHSLDAISHLYSELITYYTELEHSAKNEEIITAANQLLIQTVSKVSNALDINTKDVSTSNIIDELPQITLTQPDYSDILNQILNTQEQIKQSIMKITKLTNSSLPLKSLSTDNLHSRQKKISSAGTSDSENESDLFPAPPVNSPVRYANTDSEPISVVDKLTFHSDVTDDIQTNEIEVQNETNDMDTPMPVADIKEAAETYNTPEYITLPESNIAYFCRACEKQFKFSSTKPHAHCKTTTHNKKFLQWVNKNKLIIQ